MFFNKCPHTPDIVGQSFNYGQEREREREDHVGREVL